MASNHDIGKVIKSIISYNNMGVTTLSDEEKQELKERILMAIRQVQSGKA